VKSSRVDAIWIVTRPTQVSTLADIVFQTSVPLLANQFRGGLSPDDIMGVYLNEQEARAVGTSLLAGTWAGGQR